MAGGDSCTTLVILMQDVLSFIPCHAPCLVGYLVMFGTYLSWLKLPAFIRYHAGGRCCVVLSQC